jgi:hypothetical protein
MTMEPILILFAPMNDSCCNQEWLLKESCDEIDKKNRVRTPGKQLFL